MARPIKQNADYFPHANNMRSDRKLRAVRARFGLEGYAVYTMLLESLTEANFICLMWDEIEVELLAGDFGIDSEKLKEMVEYFVAINLLQLSQNVLFCDQLDRRLRRIYDKRNTTIEGLRRENGINTSKTSDTDKKTGLPSRERKEKKSKGNKRLAQNTNILSQRFVAFWELYPKKRDKKKAETVFKKINPDDELFQAIVTGLKRQIKSDQWTRDDGKYIPYPSSWLNGERWTDESEVKVNGIDPKSNNGRILAEINTILSKKQGAPQALIDKYSAGRGYNSYDELYAELSRKKSEIMGAY